MVEQGLCQLVALLTSNKWRSSELALRLEVLVPEQDRIAQLVFVCFADTLTQRLQERVHLLDETVAEVSHLCAPQSSRLSKPE